MLEILSTIIALAMISVTAYYHYVVDQRLRPIAIPFFFAIGATPYALLWFLVPQTLILNGFAILALNAILFARLVHYLIVISKIQLHVNHKMRELKGEMKNLNVYASRGIIQHIAINEEKVSFFFDYIMQNKRAISKVVDMFNEMEATGTQTLNPNIEGLLYLAEVDHENT